MLKAEVVMHSDAGSFPCGGCVVNHSVQLSEALHVARRKLLLLLEERNVCAGCFSVRTPKLHTFFTRTLYCHCPQRRAILDTCLCRTIPVGWRFGYALSDTAVDHERIR